MENKKDEQLEQNQESEEQIEPSVEKELTLEEQFEQLQRENQELKNQYFKAYADASNYQKRAQKELENAMKYRIQSFASGVLPVIDNLERALAQETSDTPLKEGILMIYQQLLQLLKNEGVEEIEALHKPFDPHYHQSLLMEKVEGVESNQVIEVLQKGYLLKDRILRVALVKVSE